jgi:hypothetical protein
VGGGGACVCRGEVCVCVGGGGVGGGKVVNLLT